MSNAHPEWLDMDEAYARQLYRLAGPHGTMVFRPFAKERTVKNLGWLLRHWREVRHFYVVALEPSTSALMIARVGDGLYVTKWASLSILREWVKRPVFRDVEVRELLPRFGDAP